MEKIFTSLLCLIVIASLKSQTFDYIEINNIKARVNAAGYPLFNEPNYSPGFEAPKGSGKHTIYASNLWIGGLDANQNLHLAAETYSGNANDFIPGPVMDSIHYASEIPSWRRVWKINKTEVDNHIQNYDQPGYIIPQVFLDWPAHGDTLLGQAAYLAPFVDINSNGLYEPVAGDYPYVPGDQCIYYIFNDDTVHAFSGGEKLKLEIHAFVYAFNCPSDSALNHTVFVKYKMINRSSRDYFTSSIGVWTDIDIGGAPDDYIGCDLENGAFYGYSGDSFDDNFQGSLGYGNILPAQAVMILAGPYADNDNIDNPITSNVQNAIDSTGIVYMGSGTNYGDGIVDNERLGLQGFRYYNNPTQSGNSYTYDPSEDYEYYQYLNALWLDSTHMVYGGDGHISSAEAITNGLILCNYMFPGDSDPLNWNTSGITPATINWNEHASGNVPSDRRGLGCTGNFTFESGEVNELEIAFIFAADYSNLNDSLASVVILRERISDIKSYYITNQIPCGSGFQTSIEEKIPEIQFYIFPNPNNGTFTVNYNLGENISSGNFRIYDAIGKLVYDERLTQNNGTLNLDLFLASGVYFWEVRDSGNKILKSDKLVIY